MGWDATCGRSSNGRVGSPRAGAGRSWRGQARFSRAGGSGAGTAQASHRPAQHRMHPTPLRGAGDAHVGPCRPRSGGADVKAHSWCRGAVTAQLLCDAQVVSGAGAGEMKQRCLGRRDWHGGAGA